MDYSVYYLCGDNFICAKIIYVFSLFSFLFQILFQIHPLFPIKAFFCRYVSFWHKICF